jgi:hypothetical protein
MANLKKSQKSLKNWTEQEWDNVSGTKGGRYLPKSVRDSLTPGQKAAENKKKKDATASGKPSASYNKELAKKVRNAKDGMMVKAPAGYHWMKHKGGYKLMKHTGKFVEHDGGSLKAEFKIQKKHG